jgi:hypothetical protein
MADIDVVKKGSRTWLWILVALAVVLLAWWFLSRSPRGPRTAHIAPRGGHPAHASAIARSDGSTARVDAAHV